MVVSIKDQEASARFIDHPIWVELSRAFDSGWTAEGAALHLVGDGLFNLYYMGEGDPAASQHQVSVRFAFSAARWQNFAVGVSAMWFLLSVLGLVLLKRRDQLNVRDVPEGGVAGRVAAYAAQASGVAAVWVLGLAIAWEAISWTGLPSRMPWLPFPADPYGAGDLYLLAALALMLISLTLRLVAAVQVAGRRRRSLK
jgi:hypothetical protein